MFALQHQNEVEARHALTLSITSLLALPCDLRQVSRLPFPYSTHNLLLTKGKYRPFIWANFLLLSIFTVSVLWKLRSTPTSTSTSTKFYLLRWMLHAPGLFLYTTNSLDAPFFLSSVCLQTILCVCFKVCLPFCL